MARKEKEVTLKEVAEASRMAEESVITRIKTWVKTVLGGMGGAVVSEKSKTVPPEIGNQPYKGTPKKGLL